MNESDPSWTGWFRFGSEIAIKQTKSGYICALQGASETGELKDEGGPLFHKPNEKFKAHIFQFMIN